MAHWCRVAAQTDLTGILEHDAKLIQARRPVTLMEKRQPDDTAALVGFVLIILAASLIFMFVAS